MITEDQKIFFEEEGYLAIENLLSQQEVKYYEELYDAFLENKIDAAKYRSDLSGSTGKKEGITQIMVPSRVLPELLNSSIHKKSLTIAKSLLGDDMALDFDMLINKGPQTNSPTPWHQDAAYWINMLDKRAVSCWVAIDRAFLENGCMWYTPKSHKTPLLPHTQNGNKGALSCEGSEEESVYIELDPGSCVFHHGGTLHYSRGNTTSVHRRAFITNFRPMDMIQLERKQGVDHTGERKARTDNKVG